MALALVLRSALIDRVAVEHFDEGVYSSGYFAEHLGYQYPDLHLYAPPLLPNVLRSVLYFTGGNPHAVVWVNVVAGSLLVGAVWLISRDWFGREAALAAGILMATSEFAILYSRTTLTDTLLSLFLTLGVWAGRRAVIGIRFSNGRGADIPVCHSRRRGADFPVCHSLAGSHGMKTATGAAVGGGRESGSLGWQAGMPAPPQAGKPAPREAGKPVPRQAGMPAPLCAGRPSSGMRWVFAAGGFAALAWWTKYNGWLTLAITGAGTIGWVLFERPGWRASRLALSRWSGTAGIALLLWSPVLWMLQDHGGYAAVAANHAGYIGGFANWWDSAVRQVQAEVHIDGSVTLAGFALLAVGIILCRGRAHFWSGIWGGFLIVISIILTLWSLAGHNALLLAFLATLGITSLYVRSARKQPLANSDQTTNLSLANEFQSSDRSTFWFALAWLAGLTTAIPLYRPYPRLLLPWIVIATCCSGQGLVLVYQGWRRMAEAAERRWTGLLHPAVRNTLALLMLIVAATLFVPLLDGHFIPWQPRTGLRDAAMQVLDDLPAALADRPPSPFEDADCVLYVLGEPGLYYHLASQQGERKIRHVAQPASNLGMLRPGATAAGLPAFLVTGLHAHRDHPELLNNPPAGLKLITEYPYLASDLVLLDDVPPAAIEQHREQVVRFWAIGRKD